MDRIGNTEVGRRIASARDLAGMTQAELAAKLGASTRSVQEWESGRTGAWRHLRRIAEETGVTTHYLVHGEEQPSQPLPSLASQPAPAPATSPDPSLLSLLGDIDQRLRAIEERLAAIQDAWRA